MKSGERIIGEIVSEDEFTVKIRWKENLYDISKGEVSRINREASKKESRKIFIYKLRDGSEVTGFLADEDAQTITIKTNQGFQVIEKSKVLETKDQESSPEKMQGMVLSKSDHSKDKKESDLVKPSDTFFGITGSGFANSYPVRSTNKTSLGGGFFFEPSTFRFGESSRFGLRAEYLVSRKDQKYDFYNTFAYILISFKWSKALDFYGSFGLGASFVQYTPVTKSESGLTPFPTEEKQSIGSFSPSGYIELGWQGLHIGNMNFRIGGRYIIIQEKTISQGMGGIEFAAGYRF